MADRKMTFTGFIAKATKPNVSAAAFLATHRNYMLSGELASITSPILLKVDMGELLPTPALHVIATAVMNHVIASDLQKLDDKLNNPPQEAEPKAWLSSIYDSQNVIQTRVNAKGEVEELIKEFDKASDGDRWSDRMLFDGADGWFAIIEGHGTMVRVERSDAMARILKKPKSAVAHQKSTTTNKLGFGVRAKQDRASFSRG